MIGHTLYRYVDDWQGDDYAPEAKPTMLDYTIEKLTPKGCWVRDENAGGFNPDTKKWGKLRFVLSESTKRFAYPTPEEALKAYIARKNRQIKLLSGKLQWAEMLREKAIEQQGASHADE